MLGFFKAFVQTPSMTVQEWEISASSKPLATWISARCPPWQATPNVLWQVRLLRGYVLKWGGCLAQGKGLAPGGTTEG
jgi:hypothetical protein